MVGGERGVERVVEDVGREVVAVRVVGLDQRLVGGGRVLRLRITGPAGAGVDVAGEDLELTAVGVPSGMAGPGDLVVAVESPGAGRADVGRIDQVGGDPAGQFARGRQLVECVVAGDGALAPAVGAEASAVMVTVFSARRIARTPPPRRGLRCRIDRTGAVVASLLFAAAAPGGDAGGNERRRIFE